MLLQIDKLPLRSEVEKLYFVASISTKCFFKLSIRKSGLEKLIYNDTKFLIEYSEFCEIAHACDIVTPVIAERRGIKIFDINFSQHGGPLQSTFHRILNDNLVL